MTQIKGVSKRNATSGDERTSTSACRSDHRLFSFEVSWAESVPQTNSYPTRFSLSCDIDLKLAASADSNYTIHCSNQRLEDTMADLGSIQHAVDSLEPTLALVVLHSSKFVNSSY